MAKLFNRAKMTTSTTGSGTVTLDSASVGYQSFADAGVSNGDVVQYVIEEGGNFEIGTGTYSATGTSLTRSPTESSNSNAAISLNGAANVSITAVADDLNRLQNAGSDIVTVSASGAAVTGNITVTGTVDGRDVAADGTKLDGIEASADVTDTANVTAAGALMDSEVTNLAQVKAFDSSDYATAAQGAKADAALPKAGGTMTGAITFASGQTFDGRDVSADGSKLDGIESGATADQTASEILTAIKTVDGSGSGLDADTLDGSHASAFLTGNQTITLSGDASGSGTTSISVSLSADSVGASEIAANAVGASELNVTGNGTTSQFLRSDGDGTFTWATPTDTNTTYSAGSGLDLSGTTFSHTDTSSQASVNNSGRTYIQDITLDTYGHVTGISSATETVTDTNTTSLPIENSAGTAQFTATDTTGLQFVGSGATSVAFDSTNKRVTISSTDTNTNTTYSAGSGLSLSGTTFSHSDTSSQASVNNSGATVIQDVTVDTYGHVTGLGSKTMTLADLGYTGATNANYITNNNQLTNGAGYTTYTANQSVNTSSNVTFEAIYANDWFRVNGNDGIYWQTHNGGWMMTDSSWLRSYADKGVLTGGTMQAGNFNTTSDIKLKENVVTLENSLDKIKAMRGVSFDWKDSGKSTIGLIAQEVEQVMPELVEYNEEDDVKTVSYANMVAVLIEAVKEQQEQIDALKEQLNS